jgi:hypothetical protein
LPRYSKEAVARDREQSRLRAAARRAEKIESNREDYLKERRLYEERNREHINDQRRFRYGADSMALASRPFIGWDGEGTREFVGYVNKPPEIRRNFVLFGCSMFPDDPLIGRRLSTKTCLDYLLYVKTVYPDAFHVGFAFKYDVDMILSDLPPRFLRLLAKYGKCRWEGYIISYIPGKIFRVSKGYDKSRVSFTLYDTFGFFHCKYTTALLKFGATTREEISKIIEGKDERNRFTFADIDYILAYWQDEISYFPVLMDKLRDACYDAGLFITAWHGPGALATYILRKRGVKNWKSKDVPPEVQIAIQTAYAGGRFQPWRCGLYLHSVYTADINSAYIYACSLLPRLDNGRWRRVPAGTVDPTRIARFGLYRIAFDDGTDKSKLNRHMGAFQEIHPLFNRDKYSQVAWPRRTEGWYWSPEATIVSTNPSARFLEAWIYDDDGSYPFAWVDTEFNKRLTLQHEGNPAEKTLKWALAAMYGAFAQRVGWDTKTRKPPPKHELAWAGFITSWCRAEMYKLGYECWRRGGLVSIDTDGIMSTVPFEEAWLERGVGERLGQWKLEEFTGLLYWQSGFYWSRDGEGNWSTAKTRGVKRGSLDVNVAFEALESSHYELLKKSRPAAVEGTNVRFITFKDALNRHKMSEWQQWKDTPYRFEMGNGSTYRHIPMFCAKCRNPDVDMMHVLVHRLPKTVLSEPHILPWLQEQPSLHKIAVEDFVLLDTDIVDNLLCNALSTPWNAGTSHRPRRPS